MSKQVTIGGDRLGSGNKMQTSLHNYQRSTHNLSKDIITTAAPGVLYPIYTNIGLNGDTFDIDLDAACLTIPTKGPLFGSFKLQIDVFGSPIRLYQGILHNNPLNIGLKMSQVKFPMLNIPAVKQTFSIREYNQLKEQINNSSLIKYLGLSGIGICDTNTQTSEASLTDNYMYRRINALPALAYYDIFKNYYANKQEKNAYIITPSTYSATNLTIDSAVFYKKNEHSWEDFEQDTPAPVWDVFDPDYLQSTLNVIQLNCSDSVEEKDVDEITITFSNITSITHNLLWYVNENILEYEISGYNIFIRQGKNLHRYVKNNNFTYVSWNTKKTASGKYEIKLTAFPLENIDRMRMDLLSKNHLNEQVIISDDSQYNYLPYKALISKNDNDLPVCANEYVMNGLCVKTYQSDIFNNWVQTEWIDGENGINAITAVDTSGGNFKIDALILAKKIYDVLNRVAISGGTFEDWQEAVYTQNAVRKAETPIWYGGMSDEIVFEQIIQTTPTAEEPLGNMGGKGTLLNHGRKGGHIEIKCNEPMIITIVASITPRIMQTQGNKWYMTELQSMDDLHKPALDGIGFQELITEQMAWFDAHFANAETEHIPMIVKQKSAGKIPAWLNYMTDVNEAFGEFTEITQRGYNILGRHYDINDNTGYIKDLTTYIDPTKYNYAFALARLDAQNFWLQVRAKIIARRIMSAKIIPNL